MITIKISKDFSPFPAGRCITDGNFSGEKFRNDILIPAIENNDVICIDFDGGFGYASNFLEEVFGGLIRSGYTKAKLLKQLQFISKDDPLLISEVLSYLEINSWC